MPTDKLPKDLQDSLIEIFKIYDKEDSEARNSLKKTWKKHEEFWSGAQYIFWSAKDDAWRSPVDMDWQSDLDRDAKEELGSFYDHVVNIFRGHGEAIIAALSAQIPSLRFTPDDADDSDDVLTAQTYNKISDLIQRHNKTKLMALKAFFYLYLHGVVASYIYKDSDFKYGSHTIPDFTEMEVDTYVCPECDYDFTSDDEPDSTEPSTNDSLEEGKENEGKSFDPKTSQECPGCGQEVKPKKGKKEVAVPAAPKVLPKTRVKIDIFGGLQVKVRITARNQDETPYLILYSDVGKENAIEDYPDLEDYIVGDHMSDFDRFSKTSFTSKGDPELGEKGLITIYKIWMRPAAFNLEKDKDKRNRLKKRFPKGVRLEVLGKDKKFGAAEEEELDPRWRIGQSGLSTYIHSDPMCAPIVPVQELRNTVVNLSIETIEHGIPATYADPKVVNFGTYDRFESVPGYVYQTLAAKPGVPIAASFYETGRATLSKDVPVFQKSLDNDAQFVLGSFPSIYGGPSQKDRSTLGEYNASRQIALQRLQIAWQLFVDWFKTTQENAVRLYVDTVTEDQKFVVEPSIGNYVNVWIRQSELEGKVGGCESEADASFPMSLGQKKGVIMELMQLNNDYINAALYTPENARQIQEVLGLNEFKLPGEEQRTKQIYEFRELVKEGPIAVGGTMGQTGEPEEVFDSTVPIEPEIDDDMVHAETCRALLVSTTGIDLKRNNPKGYMNIYYHMKAHLANNMKKTMEMNATPPGVPPQTTQVGVEQ